MIIDECMSFQTLDEYDFLRTVRIRLRSLCHSSMMNSSNATLARQINVNVLFTQLFDSIWEIKNMSTYSHCSLE